MFLNKLNNITKESFLKLCVHASISNGVFADEERDMLFAYCREMDIVEHIPETPETFDELVSKIKDETNREEKNIYILEILALIKSDGVYDSKEKDFMRKLSQGLDLSYAVIDEYNYLLDKYLEIGKEIYSAIKS